jgi:hypothetical protein
MNKSVKILVVESLYFRLPDDFNGTKDDAFKLMAEYWANRAGREEIYPSHKEVSTWDRFVNLWPHDEQKISAAVGVGIAENGEFKYID